MNTGTRSLTRSTAAWLACLAFSITYLLSYWVGASPQTALTRGGVAAFVTWTLSRPLLLPLFDTLMTALTAAEEARREADE